MNFTQKKIVIITTILIVIACFFAVYLRLFTGKELWYEMFAAILGVIISAVITMILLKGQTETDAEREKTAKVFEEKLKIYQEYIDSLHEVVKDRRITGLEKVQMEFRTAAVAMHCRPENIRGVSESVKDILALLCVDYEKRKREESFYEEVMLALFKLVQAFRMDLYGNVDDWKGGKNEDSLLRVAKTFAEAYREAEGDDTEPAAVVDEKENRIRVDLNVLPETLSSFPLQKLASSEIGRKKEASEEGARLTEKSPLWENQVLQWKDKGWIVENLQVQYNRMEFKNEGGIIAIGWRDGQGYLEAEDKKDAGLPKFLRWEFKGRKSKGVWWKTLEGKWSDLIEEDFWNTLQCNVDFQRYMIDWIQALMDVLDWQHRTWSWKEALTKREGWNFDVWYWSMLQCKSSLVSEGNPYLEIYEKAEDKHTGLVYIKLSNEEKNAEKLQRTLQRIGVEAEVLTQYNTPYVFLEKVPPKSDGDRVSTLNLVVDAKTIAGKADYWMDRIG